MLRGEVCSAVYDWKDFTLFTVEGFERDWKADMCTVIRTVVSVLLLPKSREAIELVISCACTLQALCVSTAFVQVRVLALLLGDRLVYFAQPIADHFAPVVVLMLLSALA